MGFFLSKLLLTLVVPPGSLLALMVAGLLLARRWPRGGRGLLVAGVALLYLLALPSVADRLIRPLEAAAPPFSGPARADAVVVLGGGVRDLSWVPAPAAPTEGSLERLVTGLAIARSLDLPLVLSGGTGEPTPGDAREGDALAAVATRLGWPTDRLLVENASRSTVDNAAMTARLITGRTIVLVTSAFHLRRASAIFRKQGFTVLPAPAGYRSQARPWSVSLLVPSASSLSTSSTAVAEYLSLAWASLTGQL